MTQIELGNGVVKLTAPGGVKDTRNGAIYSEATVKAEDAKYFVEA